MKRLLLPLELAALVTVVACGGTQTPTGTPARASAPSASPSASAVPRAPDEVPLPLWSAVRKGVLANGLTYYVLPHHKPEKRAFLWLAVNAGSVQEDEDQRGLAHFTEHMAFNGTKRFPKQEITNYLEKIGMRFGADLNAYTGWEQTVYQLEVPTDDPGFVPRGLDILRDWAGALSFDPVEIDKERGVVLEEWRLGRGAGKRLFDKQAKVLFQGSRYADRITIGLPEIIEHAKPETLVRFYRDWYRPDLMAVVAVGDFDSKAIEQQIQARFADLGGPSAPRARPRGGVPAASGTRVSIETDREATATRVTVANLIGHLPESSARDYRRQIGQELFGLVLQERFDLLQRKPETPFTSASGAMRELTRDVDTFERGAQVKGDRIEDALRALLVEVARIERHGVTATELDRARANVARMLEHAAENEATTDSREFSSEITRNFFQGELMIGRVAEKELTLKLLPTFSVDELNHLASAFAGEANRVVLVSAPEGKPVPTRERVLGIVDEVSKTTVAPWQDQAPTEALMAKAPTAGRIVKESHVEAIRVTDWTLSNGVRVIVKPTDFALDSVLIRAISPGGEAMVPDADYGTARFAAQAVEAGGVGDFDAEALRKVLAGKQARADVGLGEVSESVDAAGSPHDLETLFQLIHLRMTAPRKDEPAFNVWRSNLAEQLSNALRSPEVQFGREAQSALWRGNLRHRAPEPAEVQKIDLDRALSIYRERFGDASDFTFVIVGAVELDRLRPLVETYLGSLPGTGRHEREKDLGARKAGGIVKKSWPLGLEPKASVRLDLHGDEPWTRDQERDMFILSRVVSIRLREVLREDMGGVYGIGVEGTLARSPHTERSFSLSFGCDPGRVDELTQAAFAEMAAIAHNGIGPEVLEKVKQTFVRARETELRTNHFWAGWLATAYRYGDDPALVLDTGKVTTRITSDHVKAAARRYLDAKQYFEAVRLPAAAHGSSTP